MISPLSSSYTAVSSNSLALKPAAGGKPANETDKTTAGAGQTDTTLSEEAQRIVASLAQTDREVRAHEAAHLAAAGGLAMSGASYGFQTGPDGKRYAVSGEVQISLSAGRTPEETLARAQQIRSAALAPSNPSAQDLRVAAEAMKMANEAQAQRMKQALSSSYDASRATPDKQIDVQA